ncbi:MAG TPA: class I SAM-dependent methyltransferase [Polyangiaceae bacterium]|nr:class I SAM-dependent methyltransferase [Polyangiaceae bacterium]
MTISEELRKTTIAQAQGAMALNLAFIGVANGLLEALVDQPASPPELAQRRSLDPGYVLRWCEAAYGFGYVDLRDGRYALTELGRAFLPGEPDTLMPFAVGAVLGAHMAERAAGLMRTGERPGESVLAERATILPWFGPMLEATFGSLFEREVLPGVADFAEVGARGGVVLDLGCGNGWYLRRLAARFPALRGIGLDGFEENVRQATEQARREGLGERLTFLAGDIYEHAPLEPVALVAMNRALHHVWDRRERVFPLLRDALEPGGVAVIWEPAWPAELEQLRDPRMRAMAVQNLSEHVQGNHFLRPPEIEAAFAEVGMPARTLLFGGGLEAVVVAKRVA